MIIFLCLSSFPKDQSSESSVVLCRVNDNGAVPRTRTDFQCAQVVSTISDVWNLGKIMSEPNGGIQKLVSFGVLVY